MVYDPIFKHRMYAYSAMRNYLIPMMLCGEFKAKDYSCRAQCYASLHSHFQEYLWRHDAGKAWHTCKANYITHWDLSFIGTEKRL